MDSPNEHHISNADSDQSQDRITTNNIPESEHGHSPVPKIQRIDSPGKRLIDRTKGQKTHER